jgi:hypothetical protein
MSDKKSREPYSGTPTERGRPLTDPQESVGNIIEIPSDYRACSGLGSGAPSSLTSCAETTPDPSGTHPTGGSEL